jgi:predicted metal-binding membrane protein
MGYFFVWTVVGVVVFALGVALTAMAMQHPVVARGVPLARWAAVSIAGLVQLSAWRVRRGVRWWAAPEWGLALPADAGAAWRAGMRLGVDCGHRCAGLMAILVLVGVMDLRVMAVVTAAITGERFVSLGRGRGVSSG